jgi:hypothetical protein
MRGAHYLALPMGITPQIILYGNLYRSVVNAQRHFIAPIQQRKRLARLEGQTIAIVVVVAV